jgi:hypothetical protein
VLQIVEVREADVEVLAQIQVELPEIEVVAAVAEAAADAEVLGYEVTEVTIVTSAQAVTIPTPTDTLPTL